VVAAVSSLGAPVHVQFRVIPLYVKYMDVGVSTLRAELASWIHRARGVAEIIVTDRGTSLARLLPVDTAPQLDQLVQDGVWSRPRRGDRATARGADRVRAHGPVVDLAGEQRR